MMHLELIIWVWEQLLYTTVAQSCLINQEYLDDFEKPLNVFATKSRASAT
jgi:hypothetical protein